MDWFVRVMGVFLLTVTLLPLLRSGKWYVRWWDFPRLQIFALLVASLLLVGSVSWYRGLQGESFFWIISLLLAAVWQFSHIVPYSWLYRHDVESEQTDDKENGSKDSLKIMVANIDYENSHAEIERVEDQLLEEHPDILVIIEYDETWAARLIALRSRFRFHHEEKRGQGLGIAIWSDLRIEFSETKHLVSKRRASLWTVLETKFGRRVNFVAVHPTPPGLIDSTGDQRRDSNIRDAELIVVAKQIADQSNEAWIVAGDFNDVAWSHTTRLFRRISGLLDPRIGRTFMGTYMAQYPPCRCPIDHIFVSNDFKVSSLRRKRIVGSDHFALLGKFVLRQGEQGTHPHPRADDEFEAQKILEEGLSDADNRGVATEP